MKTYGNIGAALFIIVIATGLFVTGDHTLFAFKIANALADQVQDLAVAGPSFIFGNVVKLIVQLRVDLNAKMFVLFIAHNPPRYLKVSIF
jgi:hypothetical protein